MQSQIFIEPISIWHYGKTWTSQLNPLPLALMCLVCAGGCWCESVSKRRLKALGWPLMTVSWKIITSLAFLPQARRAGRNPYCGCIQDGVWPAGKLCRCPVWFAHHSALFIRPQCHILCVKKDLFHITGLPFSQGYLWNKTQHGRK